MLSSFSEWFWDEYFWLPENVTWSVFNNSELTDGARYPQFADLATSMLMGVVILPIRFIIERFLFLPLGYHYGLPTGTTKKKASPNPLLEKAFHANGRIQHKQVQGLAKQLDWTERQVERWFRQRKVQERLPHAAKKYTESCWRFAFYSFTFAFGVWCLWDKPWLTEINQCWSNYPYQKIDVDVWWYYMLELSLYWSLLYSLCTDIKRKDFWEMVVHHVVTLCLLSFSWTCNFVRVGTLILLVHDIADIFLEATKVTKYLNKQRLCDVLFVIFTAVWFLTRIYIFPFVIVHNTIFEPPNIVPPFPGYYIFNVFLCLLEVLHLIWTYMILRILVNTLRAGKMEGDIRSETEEDWPTDKST